MPSTNVKASGNFDDLNRSIQNTAKMVADLGLKLSGIQAAGKAFDMVTGAIGGTVNALAKVGQAAMGIEAIGKSAVAMGLGLVQGNAALEMTTISFQTLLGSASAAQDMIKQLTQFAQATPFELTGLEANTQKLLAFGFQAKDIIPLMTSLGDAISALGGTQDNLNSLVYVMGQMRSEAHINAGDIMQMVNLGIPALQMLADHYHKTTGEIQEMISKGLIPGKDAVAIFSDSLEKQYGGMMKAQSATFNGMLSNLQDWASATMITLTKPLFEPAKKALAALLNYVQSPAGVAAVNKLAGYIQMGVDKMTKAFVEFEPKIRPTLQRVLQLANAVRGQFTPGIISLLPHLTELWKRLEPVALGVFKFYENVKPLSIALAALQGYLKGGINGALEALQGRFAMLSGYIKIAFDAVLVQAQKWGPTIISWVANTAIRIAQTAVQWGEALIQWAAPYAARLVTELINLGGKVINWAVGFAPVLANQLLTWAESIVNWVLPAIPKLMNALGQLAAGILNWAEREIPILTREVLKWTDILAGWVIPAIPGVVRGLEQMGATVVNWGITRLPQLLGQVIVGVGKGFGVNLRPAVNDLLLIFNSLVNNIRSTVLPAFQQMIGFLSGTAQPILDRLAGFIANTVIPTLASMAAFTMDVLVPAAVRITDVLGNLFGPALTLIGSIIRNQLLPALTDSWNYFDKNYTPGVQSLSQKLGVDLANGVQSAVDKFKAALPVLESFYQKIEPIVGKALELYRALSPISILFDTIRGLLTGGLNGGFDALKQHVLEVGQVFGIDLNPVLSWVSDFVKNTLIPGIKTFAENVLPKIGDAAKWVMERLGDFSNFISVNVWPTAKKVFEWIGDKGTDLFNAVANTLKTTVFPAIEKFGNWISTWLWPRLQDVFGWIGQNVGPVLDTAFGVLETDVIPWIGTLVDSVLNHVIPVLTGWWGVLVNLVQPGLEMIGQIITQILGPALDGMFMSSTGNVQSFNSLADVISQKVIPVLETATNVIHGVWTAMGGWLVEGAIDGFSQMADKASADTAKIKDLTQASDDFKKQNDAVNKQLTGQSNDAFNKVIAQLKDYGTQLKSGMGWTDMFTSSQNDVKNRLEALSNYSVPAAKAKLAELQAQYQTGQISQEDYQKAVEDVTKKLDSYQQQIAIATQQLKEGKTPVDNYTQSVSDLMTTLTGKSATTMTGAKDQIDALTKKYLDGKGTLQDWQGAMDSLASHLDKNGRDAIKDNQTKINDLSQKYIDGKITLDDYKKGFNEIVLQMENEGKTAQEKAKDRLDDLNKKFWDGKLSFDDYKKAADEVNRVLDIYNQKQIAQKKLTANFDEFIGQIANVATKLATLQPPAWLANMTPDAQAAFWQSIKNGAPNYNPPPVYGHAVGTSNAPGGLSLVGEKGMELIRMATSGALMLATRPTLLNLPKGSQVFNNQQTRTMLPNPASAQQISNMYATSYANRSWDYSTTNSNNNSNNQHYYINGQPTNQWSFGQAMRWATAR